MQEYPGTPCQVLDGDLFAIAGIYDLHKALSQNLFSGNTDKAKKKGYLATAKEIKVAQKKVKQYLKLSLNGFIDMSARFRAVWVGHWFDTCRTIPSPIYYRTNIQLLNYLAAEDRNIGKIKKSYLGLPTFWQWVAERRIGEEEFKRRMK